MLTAISPIDGRYRGKTEPLANYFSEYALIRYRVRVEIEYFIALCELPLPQLAGVGSERFDQLRDIYRTFDEAKAQRVKDIEKVTNHDVKAVEYFIKEAFDAIGGLEPYKEFIHFGLTSQDINNTSVPLSLKEALEECYYPLLEQLIGQLKQYAETWKDVPMLAKTHGQPASPTTLGKEIANVVQRMQQARARIAGVAILGKMNGAVGNYNAHLSAYPDVDWPAFSQQVVEGRLGLTFNPLTTQIEPHDYMADLFHALVSFNTVLLDLCRDIWSYISIGYFTQKLKAGEVGSSTMPHKVNPIDFENAEGNLGLANALLSHLAQKLPVSRWQRDLTDSTVLRNVGVALGYSLLAYDSAQRGLGKLQVAEAALAADLDANWEVLAEPIQTVMRRYGVEKPYEKLKELTRGRHIGQADLSTFIDGLDIPETARAQLRALTPASYIGRAEALAKKV